MNRELEMARELVKALEEKEQDKKVLLSSLKQGDTFVIGENEFLVRKQGEGQTEVISKNLIGDTVEFGDNINYRESNLREIVENEIQPMIEEKVGADNLIEHEVDLISVDKQNEFGKLMCKVRPLTFAEATESTELNNLLVSEELSNGYWTCTPWSTKERGWSYSLAFVSPSGCISNRICNINRGVRPFCILKSNIFVSREAYHENISTI